MVGGRLQTKTLPKLKTLASNWLIIMKILKNLAFINLKSELTEKINALDFNLKYLLENTLQLVEKWEFFTDDKYSPIPFFCEINNYRKPRKLNIKIENRFEKKNIFSFGFSFHNHLLLQQTANEFRVFSKIYDYSNNEIIFIYHFDYQKNNPNNLSLLSLSAIKNIGKDKIYLSLNSNLENFSVIFYHYDNELISKAYRYSAGWVDEVEYLFFYDENGKLENIKIGDKIHWSK